MVTGNNETENQSTTLTTQATMSDETENQPVSTFQVHTARTTEQRTKIALPIVPVVVSDPDGKSTLNIQ